MKKILIGIFLFATTTIFADITIGVRISDSDNHHITHNKFKPYKHHYNYRNSKFDYKRHGYYDDHGHYYGYFDKRGYVYNNKFFHFNKKYTYRDRLKRTRHYMPRHSQYRTYRHYRASNQRIYRDYNYSFDNRRNKHYKIKNWNKKHHYKAHNQKHYRHANNR